MMEPLLVWLYSHSPVFHSTWQFSVLAVARYQQPTSRYGSVIVIYTHVGELTLDGEAINFHESLKGAFTRAGLQVDKNGRRLLGVSKVIGLFNLLGSAFEDSGLEDDMRPRMPGNQFSLVVSSYTSKRVRESEYGRERAASGGASTPEPPRAHWIGLE